MFASRFSNVNAARMVAALLTASSPIAGSFSASAQQMRLGATGADIAAACDHIKSPAQNAQCQHDKHLAEANARLAAARNQLADAKAGIAKAADAMACAKFLLAKKAEGVALDPTRLNREKGCIYAAELGMQ